MCVAWRNAASSDVAWRAHCDRMFFDAVEGYSPRVTRWDVGGIAPHAKQLYGAG